MPVEQVANINREKLTDGSSVCTVVISDGGSQAIFYACSEASARKLRDLFNETFLRMEIAS